MLEYWNNGMAPFGQINACGEDAGDPWFCHQFSTFGVIRIDQALNQLKNSKGGHGLHRNSSRLQTMTALIKSFCRGPGGGFFKKSPLVEFFF
jgi:hypothetical protein